MTSTIKVDNIENQCGGAVVTKCGGTTTITGSVVKANNIQASDGGNLVSQSGTTITLGASGDTINLASGASQSGFGRTGTVDWQTTPKTATFTAVSGEGYFCNTSGGAFTVNLPAGSAGAIVSLSDYTRTWQTNNLTVSPNGSEKLGGVNDNAALSTEGQSVTFVYVDATEGWINVQDSTSAVQGRVITPYIIATGGTITCSGDYKIHTFTGPGTFCVQNEGNACGSTAVDYLVVAGGAAGAGQGCGGGVGGGGAGGIRIGTVCQPSPLSPSPLVAAGSPVSLQGYSIVVGGGGATNLACGNSGGASGSNSSFSSFTAAGGGGGSTAARAATAGGSGGGGGEAGGAGGAGNTPPVSPAQGSTGGTGNSSNSGAGGGGFTQVGSTTPPAAFSPLGQGGNGIDAGPIFGTANGSPGGNFGGGGGGSQGSGPPGKAGGTGGGGTGAGNSSTGTVGAVNTGGGGGAVGGGQPGSNGGGSGIVIIRYKFQ